MHPNDYPGEWNHPHNIGPKRVDFSKLPPRDPAATCQCGHRRDDHSGAGCIGNTGPCDCTRFLFAPRTHERNTARMTHTPATPVHPALAVDPDGGTSLEREAARVIRTAVTDFERETLSLSAVEHLLRRLGNLADVLDRSDVAAPAATLCPDCDGPTVDHGDRFSRICASDDCSRVFVNVAQPQPLRVQS